jgi:hypothetical protein
MTTTNTLFIVKANSMSHAKTTITELEALATKSQMTLSIVESRRSNFSFVKLDGQVVAHLFTSEADAIVHGALAIFQ